MTTEAFGYFFTQVGKPLEKRAFSIPPPQGDHVVVEIAGCGLCHTDLTFFEGVQTKKAAPLILGHEISGRVLKAGPAAQHVVGKDVIIPAVLPCGVGATVLALDVDEGRLAVAKAQGAQLTLNTKGLDQKTLKASIRALVKDHKLPAWQWRVFEMSGTKSGQETAYNLLSYAGTLAIVGFTMEKLELRLSNLMAFDAECFGNWGCRPTYYDDVVKDVIANRIQLLDNVEYHPLANINEVFAASQNHQLKKRAILIP